MGSSGSSCNYVQQASDSSEFCAGTADKFPIPCPEATDLRSLQGQVTATPPLSCTADKHIGYWIGQVLLNIIPFFGPGIAQFWSEPSQNADSLKNAQMVLQEAQCKAKSVLGAAQVGLTVDVCELAVSLFGTTDGCGYIDIAIKQVSQPVLQRAIITSINVAFLCLIVICLVVLL